MFVEYCIDEINDMLFAAYIHGGDAGGPYESNKNFIKNSVEAFLKKTYLDETYVFAEIERKIGNCKYFNVPQIVKNTNHNTNSYGWE